jgi:hypothetical protein
MYTHILTPGSRNRIHCSSVWTQIRAGTGTVILCHRDLDRAACDRVTVTCGLLVPQWHSHTDQTEPQSVDRPISHTVFHVKFQSTEHHKTVLSLTQTLDRSKSGQTEISTQRIIENIPMYSRCRIKKPIHFYRLLLEALACMERCTCY